MATTQKLDTAKQQLRSTTADTTIKLNALEHDLNKLKTAVDSIGKKVSSADMTGVDAIQRQITEMKKEEIRKKAEYQAQIADVEKKIAEKEAMIKRLEGQLLEVSSDFQRRSNEAKGYFDRRNVLLTDELRQAYTQLQRLQDNMKIAKQSETEAIIASKKIA